MTTRRGIVRRPGPVVARAPRRLTAWDDFRMNNSTADGAFATFALMNNIADPEKRGCTLIRMILDFVLFPATPGAVSGRQLYSMGIGVVSDDAFSAGATGLPNPEVDSDYPVGGWLWRKTVAVFDETLATGHVPPVQIQADLRAMRKLDRSTLAFMLFNGTGEGTPFAVQRIGQIRCLYKLP